MAKEIEFLKKADVSQQFSEFLAMLEENFFKLGLKNPDALPEYLKDMHWTYERIKQRLDGLETHKIWCE